MDDSSVRSLVKADTRVNLATLASVLALIVTLVTGLLWVERRMTRNEGQIQTEAAIRESADRQIQAEMSAIRETATRSERRLDQRLDAIHKQIDDGFSRIEKRLDRMEGNE